MISDENLKQLRAMMAELLETTLEAYGLKKAVERSRSLSAERQRRFRERNANRNARVTRPRAKRNAGRNVTVTPDTTPVCITIPLVDGSEFDVTERMCGEFAELYPAVDVPQTLREIRGWNYARPTQRKTRGGVLKHINGWLAKEQNKG
jgi:hypothetical protein